MFSEVTSNGWKIPAAIQRHGRTARKQKLKEDPFLEMRIASLLARHCTCQLTSVSSHIDFFAGGGLFHFHIAILGLARRLWLSLHEQFLSGGSFTSGIYYRHTFCLPLLCCNYFVSNEIKLCWCARQMHACWAEASTLP